MKELRAFQYNKFISEPIDLVYECLHKDKHVLKWNTMIVEHIFEGSEDEITVGSTYISKQKVGKKIHTFEAEVLVHEPPYKIALKSVMKEGTSFTRYQLVERDNGTELFVEASLIPKNIYYSIVGKLTLWLSKFVFQEQYEAFIEYVYEQQQHEVCYRDEESDLELFAQAYLNNQHQWDVYFSVVEENEDILKNLFAKGYEVDADSELYLFEAIDYGDAEEKFRRWAQEVYLPLRSRGSD